MMQSFQECQEFETFAVRFGVWRTDETATDSLRELTEFVMAAPHDSALAFIHVGPDHDSEAPQLKADRVRHEWLTRDADGKARACFKPAWWLETLVPLGYGTDKFLAEVVDCFRKGGWTVGYP